MNRGAFLFSIGLFSSYISASITRVMRLCRKHFMVSVVNFLFVCVNVSGCRKSLRFWNAAFFDAVHGEREIPAIPRFAIFFLLV